MLARVQLSDLHLGDPRSTLSCPEVADQVTDSLAEISDGKVGKLVLAGDVHEECVPADLDRLEDGVAASVARASEHFFGSLFRKVKVDEVVWVPGNHDLSAWDWYCRQPGTRGTTVTPYDGVTVSRSDWPWRSLYPGMPCDLTVAYPLYRDRSPGDDFPLLLTTHGHLLDPLVLGRDSDATYLALRALGCSRPAVPAEAGEVGSVRRLARRTLDFVLALWQRYSARDYVYANYVMRRLECPSSCQYQSWSSVAGVPGRCCEATSLESDQPPAGEGYAASLPWLLEVALLDPELPSPVGEFGRGAETHEFARKKSCLTFGHDHLGIRKTVTALGVPFDCVDSGGWTSEHDGHLPHTHVLVWRDRAEVVPQVYFVRARTKAGGVL